MRYFAALCLIAFSSLANAGIVSTITSASMEIRDGGGVVLDTETDISDIFSSVDVSDTSTGANAKSMISFSGLTGENAQVDFDLSFYGGNLSSGYLGNPSGKSNFSEISYDATAFSIVDFTWNFSISGGRPFGLGYVSIFSNGNLIERLGSSGLVGGSFSGSDWFTVHAGNNYLIRTGFLSNVSGGISNIDGRITGSVAYSFNGPTEIPIPSIIYLMMMGFAAMSWSRHHQA